MSSSTINIERLPDLGRFSNNNKALLKKMLKQNYVSSLHNSTDKMQYEAIQNSGIFCLPGDWERGSHDNSDVTSNPPLRQIEGVTTEDKFFVLAVSSLINDLEHPGHFQTQQSSDEIDLAMKDDAIKIINRSQTKVTFTQGSNSFSLNKGEDESRGNFDRIDLDSENYVLEPQVWDHHPNGGPLRGANSSLFFMFRFTQPGVYSMKISNRSPLYPTNDKWFVLEVNYKFTVTT